MAYAMSVIVCEGVLNVYIKLVCIACVHIVRLFRSALISLGQLIDKQAWQVLANSFLLCSSAF